MKDAALAPLMFLAALAAIYVGCRGWQTRGIVIWHRTGGISRISGRPGRIIGTLLIVLGGVGIWVALAIARTL